MGGLVCRRMDGWTNGLPECCQSIDSHFDTERVDEEEVRGLGTHSLSLTQSTAESFAHAPSLARKIEFSLTV